MRISFGFIFLSLCFLPSCTSKSNEVQYPDIPRVEAEILNETPEWARHAIWYQIFPERFRNGDPYNNPTVQDIDGAWPHLQPYNWNITPWGHDWYKQQTWEEETEQPFYLTVQLRRYGGDIAGIIEQLDYLKRLGVNALYLNPMNDAPSLHKYDARSYHHIDRNFGAEPARDAALMASENPQDPKTWKWTSADRLFLQLIEEVHRREMRIVLDYSWNHTGKTFWAFQDVVKNQTESKYKNWYFIESFDNPATPDTNEFRYKGWAGVKELPELRKINYGTRVHGKPYVGDLYPEVKSHIFAVTKRWLDPNGDGNPSDGVDGFRLDVADQVPLGFWRDYRKWVKSINPDALLVGEVWWDTFPDKLADPLPYLRGDVFDGIMNYRWFTPARRFFLYKENKGTPTQYVHHVDSIKAQIPLERQAILWNMMGSHDTPRLSTALMNTDKYKFKMRPTENPAFNTQKPDEHSRAIQKLLLIHIFTYLGTPIIYYGDEVGMWGADDPDNRKPMLWNDLSYATEEHNWLQETDRKDAVAPDMELFAFYQRLIALRKSYANLWASGTLDYFLVDDELGLLGYKRKLLGQSAYIFLNTSDETQAISANIIKQTLGTAEYLHPLANRKVRFATKFAQDDQWQFRNLVLPPNGYLVLLRK